MSIIHHPDDSTLMSFAAGSLPEVLSAVVATHVAMCPACAREMRTLDGLGALLIGELPSAPLDKPLPQMALRAIEAEIGGERTRHGEVYSDVPLPLQSLVGSRLEDIRWRRLGFGVRHLPLGRATAAGDLRLLKIDPGIAMPEHGHGGSELTLVLQGSFCDAFGTFGPGDIADLDDEAEHQPISDARDGCVCLIASERRARFKGLLPRLLQPLIGI